MSKNELVKVTRKNGTSTNNPLVPFYKPTAVPPAYTDDNFPTHRKNDNPFFLRIGDCQFFIPPLFIRVVNQTPTQRIPTIRQKESISVKSGYNNRDIELSLWFNNIEQINGTPMEGPNNKIYYMDGLRSLVAQFKRTPFVPVVNELLNSTYGIYACTLINISISTVAGFPNCLQAKLTLREFNAQPYIGMPTPVLDRMYCWPLFRWYYQQMLLDGESFARTKLPKIQTERMTSELRFKLLPESLLSTKLKEDPHWESGNENVDFSEDKSKLKWLEDENIWMEEVPLQYDKFTVDSIEIGLGNIVTNLQLSYYQSPTHQFLGSIDTLISINITTKSRAVLADFVKLQEITQEYSRKYKDKITCGYLGVENELINMFGVNNATIQSLDTQTVEGLPNTFNIRLTLMSYNKTQKDNESADSLAPHKILGEAIDRVGLNTQDKDSYKNPMILDGVIEDMINELELYPDLELPNYDMIRKAIDEINEFRKKKGLMDLGLNSKDIIAPFVKESTFIIKKGETITPKRRKVIKFPGKCRQGDTSENVRLINNKLKEKGYKAPNGNTFTSETKESVLAIQNKFHIVAVGYVDLTTWNIIVNADIDTNIKYPKNFALLQKGSSGDDVKTLQRALMKLGFLNIKEPTGNFGDLTFKAVWDYQKDTGFLLVDGIVGANTWADILTQAQRKVIPPVTESKSVEDTCFVDPDFYIFYPNPVKLGVIDQETFNKSMQLLKSSEGRGALDRVIKESDLGSDAANNLFELLNEAQNYGADYGVPATNIENGIIDIPPMDEADIYKLMIHDMYAYSKRSTMTRAFPTAMFIFVDEGQRVRGTRLWSNFYAYHSIVSASVIKDKDNPVDVCELAISNVYHTLDTNPSYARADKKGFWEQAFLKVDKDMIEARKRVYDHMALKPGCRIHLRMGYGSAPQGLPIMFNGVIASIDVGDVITIIGQGDGSELCNPMADVDTEDHNGIFKLGTEPSDIIRTIMGARDGFQAMFTWKSLNGKYRGFSNGSKYGIEHFGYVYVNEDGFQRTRAFFHVGDQGKWSYDVTKNIYKGHPFYNDKGKYKKTTNINDNSGTDETEVGMYLYGKAPWDVFKVLAAASTDYITAPSPHNFRSTLFFGQPHWLYKYGFRYVGGNSIEERMNLDNYYELVKTFQQVHMIDSQHDIINNGLIANSKGLITAVIPTYTEGETVKSDMLIYADKNIYPECQKTAYYDTTVMQDYLGHEVLYTALGIEKSKRMARTMGISYLQHSFSNMYKGEIVILGDPAIKPYDIVYLTDTYVKMVGPCKVGRVTHSLSLDTGFVTSFKPDLITISKESGSVGTARTLSAIQMFCYNILSAKMMIHSSTALDKALDIFNIQNKDKWKTATDIAAPVLGVGVAGAILLTGPFGIFSAVIALGAFACIDKLCEWCLNVFSERDDHGITTIPLYYKDSPLLIGVKGYKDLIPFQGDSSLTEEERNSIVQEEGVPPETLKALIRERQAEHKAYETSYNKRLETGIDMFKIKSSNQYVIDFNEAYKLGLNSAFTNDSVRNTIIKEGRRIIKLCEDGRAAYSMENRGETINGVTYWDCSLYAHDCYKKAGLNIGLSTHSQYPQCLPFNGGKLIAIENEEEAKPGDLIFFVDNLKGYDPLNLPKSMYEGNIGVHHVAIYIGNGRMLEASTNHSNPRIDIRESSIAGRDAVCFGRPACLMDADQHVSDKEILNKSTAFSNGTKGLSNKDLIDKLSVGAKKLELKYNIWASLIIANACQESAWGQSRLAIKHNNLFGIKAYSDWQGKRSTETAPEDGIPYRAYDTVEESLEDFCKVLQQNRYAPIRNAKDVFSACKFVQTGYTVEPPGYEGTSKDDQLRSIISYNKLTKYDRRR